MRIDENSLMGIDEVLDLGVRVGMGNTSFKSRRKCKMFSFTPFPCGGGHRRQQKAEGLFCVFRGQMSRRSPLEPLGSQAELEEKVCIQNCIVTVREQERHYLGLMDNV